jgi:DDE family transposase
MSVREMLLLVFCLVDDELQDPAFADALRSRGPDPTLKDSEVLTIELVGELLGFDCDRRLYWFFREYHSSEFPKLARVHRTTFARQAANLLKAKQLLQQRLAGRLLGADPAWLVDSMPVPICRFARGGYVRGFKGQAAFGYDSVQRQVYKGFRLHLRTSLDGVILAYSLTAANVHDRDAVHDLEPPAGTVGIGDRNYHSPLLFEELSWQGVALQAPYRVRKKDPDPQRSRRLSRVRWKVESVNGQLTGRYRAKRVWARDLWHLVHRLVRKILSHTVAAWMAVSAGYPPLHFSALFDAC